jgi:prevent-host-death family protein
MKILNVSETRQNFSNLINEVAEGHKPIFIKGKKNAAVLMSKEDYSGMMETIYLMSVPELWESIERASKAPDSEFTPLENFKW